MPEILTTLRVPNYASNPGSPLKGQMYVNTTDNKLYYYGTSWVALDTGGAVGDVVGPAASVDNEVALFSSTTGKLIKRATGTGLAKHTAGVLSLITDSSANWDTAYTDRNKWDGGATGLVAATGRLSLGTGDAAVWENASFAAQGAGFATDTYLTGSTVTVPTGIWTQGGQYHCSFDITKTAAGTATPIVQVRFGTLGTTGDISLGSLTWAAPTAAAAEQVYIDVYANFRAVGGATSGSVWSSGRLTKNIFGTTGFSGLQNATGVLSGGFNTLTGTKIGISFNGGTSFSGTVQAVRAVYMQ